MKLIAVALPLALAGLLGAQTTIASAAPGKAPNAQSQTAGRDMLVQRLTAKLNLNAQQQKEAAAIFQNVRYELRALPNLKEEHTQLDHAIKSDNLAQIDNVLKADASTNTQALDIYTRSMAKFYLILNPTQKAQFDQMMAQQWHREMGAATPSTESR